jgi:succinoglycan biosynthesis protein ExoA
MGEIYGNASMVSSESIFLSWVNLARNFGLRTRFSSAWNITPSPVLSVVILGFRRADLLERAISSFLRHNTVENWELILVLNGAAAEVVQLGESLLAQAHPLCLIEASGRRPGAARNLGVAQSRGEIVFFLDDDTECFQDIGAAAVQLFCDPAVTAAGGANLTPPSSSALARAAGYVLGSFLGTASMRDRYRALPEGKGGDHSLILCNLAVRRKAFFAQGGFATHLISNEENVLLQQLEREGHALIHSPSLAVFHLRRDKWSGTWEQAAKYGSGRAQNLLLLPHTLRTLYFLPSLLLLYLLCLPFALKIPTSAWPLLAYASLVMLSAVSSAIRFRDNAAWLSLALYPWIHLAYGFGFLRAMATWGLRRKKLLEHAV